jgi:hypothetical protein
MEGKGRVSLMNTKRWNSNEKKNIPVKVNGVERD